MASTGKLALLTSGGDAPGMNAAIRAATLLAHDAGLEVLGVRLGYYGLVRGDFVRLQPEDVAGIQREGGTVLGSARLPAFAERAMRDTARRRLAEHPAGRIDHVRLAAAIGTDDADDLTREADLRGIDERLESGQAYFGQAHLGGFEGRMGMTR